MLPTRGLAATFTFLGWKWRQKSDLSSLQEQLEAALELTRQQLGQATREAAASGKAWGHQRLLQDRLVNVRAALCHLTQVSAQACAGCCGDI